MTSLKISSKSRSGKPQTRTYSCRGVCFSWAMIQISELSPYRTASVINVIIFPDCWIPPTKQSSCHNEFLKALSTVICISLIPEPNPTEGHPSICEKQKTKHSQKNYFNNSTVSNWKTAINSEVTLRMTQINTSRHEDPNRLTQVCLFHASSHDCSPLLHPTLPHLLPLPLPSMSSPRSVSAITFMQKFKLWTSVLLL